MALPEAPNSRAEQYLAKIAGQEATLPEAPNSRVEQYLEYIAENGTVSEEEIAEKVSTWLEDNIHEDPTVVIDTSLLVSGAAADAKATGDEIRDLKVSLNGAIEQSGIVFPKELVQGYSINASVGGTVQFVTNANRMYYSFKTDSPFSVDLRRNSSSYRVAVIVADETGICLSNTGWTYSTMVSVNGHQNAVVYVLCDFTTETRVPSAYVESAIVQNLTNELSSSSPLWEYGSITTTNGNVNYNDTTSIRTSDRLFFYGVHIFINGSDYRVKLFSYNEDGTYYSASDWILTNKVVIAEPSKRYCIQISTVDETDISMRSALQNVRIVQLSSDGSELRTIELNQFVNQKGYKNIIPLSWESGSITGTGADKNPDPNVIRTPFPTMHLSGSLKIFMADTQYRFRIYYYNSAGTTLVNYSGWYTTAGEKEYPVNPEYTYRIQIATQNASTMNMDDAIRKIVFCYSGDTIVNPIKPYWVNYIKEKTELINSYTTDGNDKSVFLFVTDTHYNESPDYLNSYGISKSLMEYVSSECNIPMLIHGGDLNSEYRTDKHNARKLMSRPVSIMRSAFESVFLTRGNHDDNIEGSNNVWDYVITQSDSYSYMFRGTKDVTFGATGTYFYHDNPHEKLRVISIDCVDFPYTNTVDATKSDLKILAYGYEQLQWLCNVLRDTPANYHIVIFTHAMLAPSVVTREHSSSSPQTRALNRGVVCDILKAYKNRQNFTYTMDGSIVNIHQDYYTGDLEGDFTNANATIVGVFSGHEHVDCIEEILDSNGNGIGIYNTCTQNSSNMFASSAVSYPYQHPMEIGTTTELVWDVVVISRSTKHVDMIRIGAYEASTSVSAVTVRSFDYT